MLFFFCKQKTAYEMRISDWSSDVCSSDLMAGLDQFGAAEEAGKRPGIQQHADQVDPARHAVDLGQGTAGQQQRHAERQVDREQPVHAGPREDKGDRKRGGTGKGVAARLHLGSSRNNNYNSIEYRCVIICAARYIKAISVL